MTYIPNTVLESARAWVQRPEGSLWFTHVPQGRTVIVSPCGKTFHFEMHPQLVLETSDIPRYLAEGLLRSRSES